MPAARERFHCSLVHAVGGGQHLGGVCGSDEADVDAERVHIVGFAPSLTHGEGPFAAGRVDAANTAALGPHSVQRGSAGSSRALRRAFECLDRPCPQRKNEKAPPKRGLLSQPGRWLSLACGDAKAQGLPNSDRPRPAWPAQAPQCSSVNHWSDARSCALAHSAGLSSPVIRSTSR